MKDEIISKITKLVSTLPIDDEPRALYLLAEVRKIFERDAELSTQFPTLQFYCNWVLHVKLDRREARRFIHTVLPVLTLDLNHDEKTFKLFNTLLTLQAFRDELRTFLEAHRVHPELCTSEHHWKSFLLAYARVVENCELVMDATGITPGGPLNLAVQSVSIKPAVQFNLKNSTLPFPMEWSIAYSDGRSGHLSLSDQGLLGALVHIT